MITNTDLTIYHRRYDPVSRLDTWSRTYVPEAWWFKDEKSSITTEGLKIEDVITVRIPDVSLELVKDDYLVKGNCEIAVKTVKDLEGKEKMKVTSVNCNVFGNNQHIKVVGV